MLANVENRVPGMPVDRKCLLLRVNHSKDGAAKIEVIKDLFPAYQQCKGALVSKNKYLVLLANEESLQGFDLSQT
jgi:hypothetical protein